MTVLRALTFITPKDLISVARVAVFPFALLTDVLPQDADKQDADTKISMQKRL
jgi:hypothetical protein